MRVLKEGTRLADRYTLVRRLGSGGMSDTWLARDRQSDSQLVLKFLVHGLAQDDAYRDLFRQEWKTGCRLMHPHIARLFEYHDDPEGPYYGQQFIDGPELGAITGQAPPDALRPFGLIADALRYAHGKGTVHRDVKASNVLLDAGGTPYLIDFGIAAAPEMPASGGTPVASSPQQLAGKSADPADDVYALGVLMHEILTGEPPPVDAEGVRRIRPPLAAADGLAVAGELERLLQEMMAPEPDSRPSAAEVAKRLADAGVAAGPARIANRRRAAARAEDDVPAETLRSIRPTRVAAERETAPSSGPDTGRGVSPKIALGGLAALMVVFLSVILWLPEVLEKDAGTSSEPAGTVEQENGQSAPALPEEDPAEVQPATEAELKSATDEALGRLLSRLERLRSRGVDQWGGQAFAAVLETYEQGDQAYLEKNYRLAGERYEEASAMLEPFFARVDGVFSETLTAAKRAFDAENHAEAVRLFELAVAITPDNIEAKEGLARARNLASVLSLTDQALRFEKALELQAARLSFEKALDLDPAWQPAVDGIARVTEAIRQRSFEQRMSEGLEALAAGDLEGARAAFNAAKALKPESREPADGLLQVDQESRLANIRALEKQAGELERNEEWQTAIATYEKLSEIDPDLQFVREGLARAQERASIHESLQTFIDNPDSLSAPATMQKATQLLLQVTTMEPTGPRLEDQKNELARLLKRAATPLTVQLVSDNATEVSIFRVGKLGTFSRQELDLRPGAYVATGSRAGYRDVRLEFRVGPEMDPGPIVIKCEEPI